MDTRVLKLGLPMEACWLYSAWPCCHLPQLFDCQRPNSPPSPPPSPAAHLPPAALTLLSAPSHPYDSGDPQAAGVDDTCQQRDSVSSVSDSRPACLSLALSDSCAHSKASNMCTTVFALALSNPRTHVY